MNGYQARVVALVALAALVLLAVPAGASATSPVLEYVTPGHSLPVSFITEGGAVNAEMTGFSSLVHCAASYGEGEITGPRSTVSEYRLTGCVTEGGSHQKCKSEGAQEEEIITGPIEADLVYLDQAKREVAMLLNPGGGTYMSFECGGESAEGRGPFLAPVSPLDKEATTFTATLSQSAGAQTPSEYEGPAGERLKAVPEGKRGTDELVTTGVESTITVHTSVPVEIKTMTIEEVEAKQHEEEAAAKKHQEEEAAAKKHQEEEAAAKKHQEEEAVAKRQQEEAAAQKEREEEARKHKAKRPTRAQLLAKALRQCKKEPKRRRARCVAQAHRKYGPKVKKGKGKRKGRNTSRSVSRSTLVASRSADGRR
jgi:hypothetical protein